MSGSAREPAEANIGVDAHSGLVYTVGVSSGSVHDVTVMERLIREDDTAVYGDKGYASGARKRAAEAAGVLWAVNEKGTPGRGLTAQQRSRNRRVWQGAREGRACVPCDEMPVRLSQRALSRPRQEFSSGILAAGARQSVPRPQDDCVRIGSAGAKPTMRITVKRYLCKRRLL